MKNHRGFRMDVDSQPVHVTGDPDMSEESRMALADLVRAARLHFGEMQSPDWTERQRQKREDA